MSDRMFIVVGGFLGFAAVVVVVLIGAAVAILTGG
jgi:hypothetical protein